VTAAAAAGLEAALAPWPEVARDLASQGCEELTGGLINHTLAIGPRWIVQRLHRIFGPEVHVDIAALTPILQARGVPVPSLVPTEAGALCVEAADGVWRVLTRLPGATSSRLSSPAQAHAAGQALARFHGALADVDHAFAFARLGIHDTERHIARLRHALEAHRDHPARDAVAALAEPLVARWSTWPAGPPLTPRIGHGDPKVANFLFGPSGEVTGIVDLDTMGWTTLDAELGDAIRSWCSVASEDAPAPAFDVDLFTAALRGYVSEARGWITEAELAALPGAGERIALELACRFAADALAEEYFAWDPARFPSRGAHNLARARNQAALAQAIRDRRPELEGIVEGLSGA